MGNNERARWSVNERLYCLSLHKRLHLFESCCLVNVVFFTAATRLYFILERCSLLPLLHSICQLEIVADSFNYLHRRLSSICVVPLRHNFEIPSTIETDSGKNHRR